MPLPENDPILVAPSPTPFCADDTVDFAAIERNVQRWAETPLSGYVLNSENGEETFLSEAEQLQIVRTVAQANQNQKLIVGGVDSPSVTETLRLAEALVEAGAELIRVRIPRFNANVRGYFDQVIPRAAAPLLIIHQMAPGMFLSTAAPWGADAEWIGDFVARENVFGYIASADLRFEARARTFIPPGKRFWTGNASLLAAGAMMGANGACMMLGNVAPHRCWEILTLAASGEYGRAAELQTGLLETDWQILSRRAAGLKAALNLLGFETGAPRAPSRACTEADLEHIRQAMTDAGLLG